MIRVRVENFQSIEDQEITIQGMTLLRGDNNAGKSALIRAIRSAVSNPDSKHLVRYGAKFCRVSLWVPGAEVIWEKGDNMNRYTLTLEGLPPKTFDKVGRGVVPEEVSSALGIYPVLVGSDKNREKLWPQVADQEYGQVFLMDRTGSVVAESLADTEKIGRLNRSLRLTESARKEVTSNLKVRREDLKRYEHDLKQFDGLDDVEEQVDSIMALQLKTKEVFKALQTLYRLRTSLTVSQDQISRYSGIEDITSPVSYENIQRAEKILESVAWLKAWKNRHQSIQKEVKRLSQNLENYQLPESLQINMEKAKTVAARIQDFRELKNSVEACKTSISFSEEKIQELEQEIGLLNVQIQQAEEESKICPKCGQELPGCLDT